MLQGKSTMEQSDFVAVILHSAVAGPSSLTKQFFLYKRIYFQNRTALYLKYLKLHMGKHTLPYLVT